MHSILAQQTLQQDTATDAATDAAARHYNRRCNKHNTLAPQATLTFTLLCDI